LTTTNESSEDLNLRHIKTNAQKKQSTQMELLAYVKMANPFQKFPYSYMANKQ
jgi:hypothetical protein